MRPRSCSGLTLTISRQHKRLIQHYVFSACPPLPSLEMKEELQIQHATSSLIARGLLAMYVITAREKGSESVHLHINKARQQNPVGKFRHKWTEFESRRKKQQNWYIWDAFLPPTLSQSLNWALYHHSSCTDLIVTFPKRLQGKLIQSMGASGEKYKKIKERGWGYLPPWKSLKRRTKQTGFMWLHK